MNPDAVQNIIITMPLLVAALLTVLFIWSPEWFDRVEICDQIRYKFHRRKKSAIIDQVKVVAKATFEYCRENKNYPTVEKLNELLDRRFENSAASSPNVKFLVVSGEWTSWDNPTGIFEERPVLNFENSALFLCVGADENDSNRPQFEYLNVDDKTSFINRQFKPIDEKWFGIGFADGSIFLIEKNIPLRTLFRFMEFYSFWGYGYENALRPFQVAKKERVDKK